MKIDHAKNLNDLQDTINRTIADCYPEAYKASMASQPAVPDELRDMNEITDDMYARLWDRLHEFPNCWEFTKAVAFATNKGIVVLLHDDKGGHQVMMNGALHTVHDKLVDLEGGAS